MQSESINELATALSKAQGEFESVSKDSLNPFFKSKYAGLPSVVKSAAPILAQNGLSVTQLMDFDDTLTTMLLHSSGQFIGATARLHLVKDDPQAQGSATTYLRRYAYMAILGLVADDDDDGNAASNQSGVTTHREPPQTAQNRQSEANGDRPAPKPRQEVDSDDAATIRKASEMEPGHEFLASLVHQLDDRGTLTDKQIGAGVKSAMKILNAPRPAREYEFAEEEDRF